MAMEHFTLDDSELRKNFDALNRALGGNPARKALLAASLPVVNRAKELAPIRTGTLRRSIQAEEGPGEREVTIGTNVEYAIYQEYGTSRMPAHPFLRPALESEAPEVGKVLAAALEQLMEEAVR